MTAEAAQQSTGASLRQSAPLLVLAAAIAALGLLLSLPLRLPLGPMYWDVALYVDAAQRILTGQMPSVDFFAPVGPLGYYLFTLGVKLFPQGQHVLIAQWSMLVVTAPMMALALADAGRVSRGTPWALLVPFLLFSVLPFNSLEFSQYPGVEGFGLYNRQTSLLLYVLACALIFVRNQRRLGLILTVLLTALFLCKITGFAAGGLVVAFAFLAGHVRLRTALAVAAAFGAILGIVEISTGITGAYIRDILALLDENTGTLLPRFFTVASQNIDVIAAAVLVALLAFWSDLSTWIRDIRYGFSRGIVIAFSALFDRDWLWLGVLLLAGITFETQNTGSQSFIMIWPALWIILHRSVGAAGVLRLALIVAIAFAAIPTMSGVLGKAARTAAAGLTDPALLSVNLGTMGNVSAKTIFFDEADRDRAYFMAHRDNSFLQTPIADTNSYKPYSEIEFQLLWLQTVDEAVSAIGAYEASHSVTFRSVAAVDFVNPFTWLLNREAPRLTSIGAVPGRTLKEMDEAMQAELAATDLALVPRCTPTADSVTLLKLYAPAFSAHRRIRLTPCYDALIHPTIASKVN